MCECIFTIGGKNETLDTANLVHVEVTYSVDCEVIDEKGYKMEKEYIKPEAELVRFVEEEEIMSNAPGMDGGTMDFYFSNLNPNAL